MSNFNGIDVLFIWFFAVILFAAFVHNRIGFIAGLIVAIVGIAIVVHVHDIVNVVALLGL